MKQPWYRELNGYHWFVLIVAALGWLFDTMDQQLFTLARAPAMKELLAPSKGVAPDPGVISEYGGIATAVFLMGWATGGLFFGVLGDRIGRAKTMMLTILLYSLCTGLSSFSRGFWDFAFYRFITGLGVGGEFAVGVALVAEVMPAIARPYALGWLQALSAVGNVSAALISIGLGHLEETGVLGQFTIGGVEVTAWRAMFLVGTLPALLAILIRWRLKEPESWQKVASSGPSGQKLGSYAELLGDARWRRRAIVGLLLATSGVVGLWGLAFFSPELTRSVRRKALEEDLRAKGEAEWDRDLLRLVVAEPDALSGWAMSIKPIDLLEPAAGRTDAQSLLTAALDLHARKETVSSENVLKLLDSEDTSEKKRWRPQSADDRARRVEYLSGSPTTTAGPQLVSQISLRAKQLAGSLTRWAGFTLLIQNVGAFFGIYGFSILTGRIGRRPAFAISFVAAGLSTALFFWKMETVTDVYWMVPLMGFCGLSLFGGYAIYFPELFPTRLRSTGTSFCYNIGRFIAALGPYTLGMLSSKVFGGYPEPLRYAGLTMCSVFVIGLLALPFAPETKDQPLPE